MMVLSQMEITHENIISIFLDKKGMFISQVLNKRLCCFNISPKRMALSLMYNVNLW